MSANASGQVNVRECLWTGQRVLMFTDRSICASACGQVNMC